MATTFSKQVQPQDGNWKVIFGILSKDPNDVTFAQQYGDLEIDFSGKYLDPEDDTFSFTVTDAKYSDVLLNKLPNVFFTYIFDDASIVSTTRYRQAVIFCNAVEAKITAALVALRAMSATPAISTTFSA